MTMVSVVCRRGEKHLLGLVVDSVCENTILDVTAHEALLGERHGVLERVVSPSVHATEEQGSGGLLRHVLVEMELEKLLGCSFHYVFITNNIHN